METERQRLWRDARDELLGMAGNALQVVQKHLDEGSLPAALGVIKAVGLGDRQLVMAFDAAQMEALERDRDRIEHQLFRRALRERSDADKAKAAATDCVSQDDGG